MHDACEDYTWIWHMRHTIMSLSLAISIAAAAAAAAAAALVVRWWRCLCDKQTNRFGSLIRLLGPHRERLGYLGDAHSSLETALSNVPSTGQFLKPIKPATTLTHYLYMHSHS